jgi:hypothetical protein
MVYFSDPDTMLHTGSMAAHTDPRAGIPMRPANATFLPPDADADADADAPLYIVPVFAGDHWINTQDHRLSAIVEVATKRVTRVDHLGPIPDEYMIVSEKEAESIIEHPEYWRQQDGKLVPLGEDERADMIIKDLQASKRVQCIDLFQSVDWRMDRLADQVVLGQAATDDPIKIAHHRDSLRDFTKSPDWWTTPMKTFEQFDSEQLNGEQSDSKEQ